jgi:Glycosyltransferase family 87
VLTAARASFEAVAHSGESAFVEVRLPRWLLPAAWWPAVPALTVLFLGGWSLFYPGGSPSTYLYDGGVYLGAAVQTAHGHLPFWSFALVHPGGIALLLWPVGLLTYGASSIVAIQVAHVLGVVVMALNATLVTRLIRPWGQGPALVSGMATAFLASAVTQFQGVKLEAYLVTFCLLALLAAFPDGRLGSSRRLVVAGLAMGFAGTIKIWAIVPAVVLLAVITRYRRSDSVRFTGAMAAGFLVPLSPFIAHSPSAFWHDVVQTQLQRTNAGGYSLGVAARLHDYAVWGLAPLHFLAPLGALLFVVLAAVVYVVRRRVTTSLEWCLVATALVACVTFLLPQQFFVPYTVFPLTFVAALSGPIIAGLRREWPALRPNWPPLVSVAVLVVIVVSSFMSVANAQRAWVAPYATVVLPTASEGAIIPAGACTVSNNYFTLLTLNRAVANVPDCPVVVDPYGEWLLRAPATPPPTATPPAVMVSTWEEWLSHAQYFVWSHYGLLPANADFVTWLHAHFTQIATVGRDTIWRQRTTP